MNASPNHNRGRTATAEKSDDPRYLIYGQVAEQINDSLRDGRRPDVETLVADHPEMAQEIRQLVSAQVMLYDLGHPPEDRGTGPGSAATGADVPGQLGDYRILREIGRGGMGVVYEAQQISLNRRVALKVLPFAAVLDPKHLQRFKNEAQAAASLRHPNIVQVFSVGCERAVHFYAMDYIEGQTLAEVISQVSGVRGQESGIRGQESGIRGQESGDRSQESGARGEGGMLSQRAALGEHGEVPDMPTPAPPVKACHPTDSSLHPVTPSPAHPGTDTSPLAALSTEGSNRDPEFFRTVARLGVQAAEALEHAHGMGVVHRDIKPSNLMVDFTLPSPSGRRAESPLPSLSGRGAGGEGGAAQAPHLWITDFGLAMTQTDANLTMTGDILGTLRYMSPEQVQAKHGVLDHRTDVYSLGLTLYELLTLRPAFPGDDRQRLIRQVIEDDPRPPRQINNAIPRDLETIVLKATAKEPDARYAAAQELADDLRRYLEDEPIRARRPSLSARAAKWSRRHRGGVTAAIAAAFLVLLTGAAFLFYGQQREARLRHEAEQQRERAEENLRLALNAVDQIYFQYARDQYLKIGGGPRIGRQAEDFLRQAMAFYEQFARANRDDLSVRVETVKAWDRVGRIRSRLGMHDEAQQACRRAVEAAEELLSEFPDDPRYRDLLCRVHYNRAAAFIESNQFDQAVGEYNQAIDINPRFAWAFHERASVHAKMGRLDQAIGDYSAAIRVDPNDYLTYHARARMHLKKGDFVRAIEDFNKAVDVAPKGEMRVDTLGSGQAYGDLAWLLVYCPDVRLRDPARAAELAAEGTKLSPFGTWTPLGVAQYRVGNWKESIAALEKSKKDPCSWCFLAMAYWQLGDKQQSHRSYQTAVEWIEKNKPDKDAFACFRLEAARLLGIDETLVKQYESIDLEEECLGYQIFDWSNWQDCLW